jgi:hypothetical protein
MLNNQQTELLNAIFMQLPNHETEFENNEGLIIYQRSLIANASKAMAITFATLHSFVGERVFTQLVQQYLIEELRTDYDWGEFGVTFSDFIANQTMPNSALLSSVAALDFHCHQVERSKNVEKDLTSLNLLSSHDAYELYAELSAGTCVLSSDFPLDEIVRDMTELSQQNELPTLNDVEEKLTEHSTNLKTEGVFYYVVWRPNFQAQYEQISKEEFDWFALLLKPEKCSLGHALDSQSNQNFSFVEWLPKAIQQQQINRIVVMPCVTKK